ncbi:MAG TPA: glycosyltransferase family 4 protein [Spirochaetota bacterium]|nr:glycosyltransferase family 4 protein [Spirochaetota bacterium]
MADYICQMTNRIKVAHLSSAHPPADTRIFYKECRTLAQAGYEVVLIIPHDRDEIVNGVRIRAVSKPTSRFDRMMSTVREVYRAALEEDAIIYHFHDPELIPVGILLKNKGKKVIYDVHEDLPRQVLTKPWIKPFLRRVVGAGAQAVEKFCAHYFDRIITVTSTIAERFPENKTTIVHNYPILEEFAGTDFIPYQKRNPLVVYVGGITVIRGIKEMVNAMNLIPETLGARLVLAGKFSPPALENDVSSMAGWSNVEYLGWQSRDEVADLLSKARIGLVLLHPTLNYMDAFPIKMFEYMAAGIPVVASNFPLWRKIVSEIGCGLVVDPLNPQAIADAVQWLLAHPVEAELMGKRGQDAVIKKYNWHTEAQNLLDDIRVW